MAHGVVDVLHPISHTCRLRFQSHNNVEQQSDIITSANTVESEALKLQQWRALHGMMCLCRRYVIHTNNISGSRRAAAETDGDADRVADHFRALLSFKRRRAEHSAQLCRGHDHRNVVGAGRMKHEAGTPLSGRGDDRTMAGAGRCRHAVIVGGGAVRRSSWTGRR